MVEYIIEKPWISTMAGLYAGLPDGYRLEPNQFTTKAEDSLKPVELYGKDDSTPSIAIAHFRATQRNQEEPIGSAVRIFLPNPDTRILGLTETLEAIGVDNATLESILRYSMG